MNRAVALSRLSGEVKEIVGEQYEFRELLYQMTRRDLLLRYKQTVMGFGWAIFMPLVNTAVFSWIQAVVLKPIPGVQRSASFYYVEPKADTGTYPGMSWAEYRDVAPRLPAIEELIAFRMAPLNVGEAGRTERTYAMLVSGNYFDALRMTPAAGRFIRPDEADMAGAEPVVVLSHEYWQTRFAGNPVAIGQTLPSASSSRPLSPG